MKDGEILTFHVENCYRGERVDLYLSHAQPQMSRTHIHRLIEEGRLYIHGSLELKKPGYKLRGGEILSLEVPPPEKLDILAEKIDIPVMYEDEHLLVVVKPSGMVVHPAGRMVTGTLVNALLGRGDGGLSEVGGIERPGIIHRLDRDTSGLLVVAKNDLAHARIAEQFRKRRVEKRYLAVVKGLLLDESREIFAPIGRHPVDRKKMTIIRSGRDAKTVVHSIERFAYHTLVGCDLFTGRTHQIRVHLAMIGHGLVGDAMYGGKFGAADERIGRVALHSHHLAFFHPVSGDRLSFDSPPPADFQDLLAYLRGDMV